MSGVVHPQLFWYFARASGFVAWALSLLAVVLGLALATKALGRKPRPAWLLDLHRFTGGLSVLFVGAHIASLVADSYVHFGRADVLVPFASGWKPAPVAAGVIAFWLLAAVEVSSLMMRRLPRRAWRAIHLSSYAVAVLATVHGITAGTDARNIAFISTAIVLAAAIWFFVVYRAVGPKRGHRRAPSARSSTAVTLESG